MYPENFKHYIANMDILEYCGFKYRPSNTVSERILTWLNVNPRIARNDFVRPLHLSKNTDSINELSSHD